MADAERASLGLENLEGVRERKPEDQPLDVHSESVDREKLIVQALQCYRPAPMAI